MINSISNVGMAMPSQPRGQGGAALSDEQKQLISETLGEFDVGNLTESDAQSIISVFKDAGIKPGRELAEAMDTAGFDAREVGQIAGIQSPPPGGPQGQNEGMNLSEEVLKELYTLLDQYYAEDVTDVDRNSLTDSIGSLLGSETSIFSAKV